MSTMKLQPKSLRSSANASLGIRYKGREILIWENEDKIHQHYRVDDPPNFV